MYKDPKRYGFIFQSYVQLTMLQMHDEIERRQTEQIKRYESEQPNGKTPKPVSRANIFQDLTNKDQKSDDKKRKSSHDEISSLKKLKTEAGGLAGSGHSETDESKRPTVDYPINMMERSIFSARYIFVENLYQK